MSLSASTVSTKMWQHISQCLAQCLTQSEHTTQSSPFTFPRIPSKNSFTHWTTVKLPNSFDNDLGKVALIISNCSLFVSCTSLYISYTLQQHVPKLKIFKTYTYLIGIQNYVTIMSFINYCEKYLNSIL